MNEDNWIDVGARLLIALIIGILVLMLTGFFSSCTRTVYVPKVTVEHDSIYVATHTRDSVYLKDSIYIREKGDTVYLERWRTQYVERLRVDTLSVMQTDTIREPYPVERPLTWAQRTWINAGKAGAALLGGTALALLAYFLSRRKFP